MISSIETSVAVSLALAILLPLVSFAVSFAIAERFSWATALLAPFFLLLAAIAAVHLLAVQWGETLMVKIPWFAIADQTFDATLTLSDHSLLMLAMVLIISFLVHLYSAGYMAGDTGQRRYFGMLGFFTFSMLGIVLADNLLLLFVFWEWVGFSSYILIGHWTERAAAASAAKKAFVMNRVGDAGFLIGLMIIWANAGTLALSDLISQPQEPATWKTAAALCILFAVAAKSAQFPLFTWLPPAMEGPTPVSALIHAATMVAAGVYLFIRVFPLFTETALMAATAIGGTTAIAGALSALFQSDIKKILAYSTISQLGLMVMALGLGVVDAALLHLFTHAFFKAGLFLSAGAVIYAVHHAQRRSPVQADPQDIRNLGGLRTAMPATFFAFVFCGASLAGIPFFSGFLSKEAILASAFRGNGWLSWVLVASMLFASFVTALYTFRLVWLIFLGEKRNISGLRIAEAPVIMRIPMVLLAIASMWFTVSLNPFDFIGWVLPPETYTNTIGLAMASVAVVGVAVVAGYFMFRRPGFRGNRWLHNAFYLDLFYQRSFVRGIESASTLAAATDRKVLDGILHGAAFIQVATAHLVGWFDRAIIDGTVNTFARLMTWIGSFTRSFQGGRVQLYIFWSVIAIIIFLIWSL